MKRKREIKKDGGDAGERHGKRENDRMRRIHVDHLKLKYRASPLRSGVRRGRQVGVLGKSPPDAPPSASLIMRLQGPGWLISDCTEGLLVTGVTVRLESCDGLSGPRRFSSKVERAAPEVCCGEEGSPK